MLRVVGIQKIFFILILLSLVGFGFLYNSRYLEPKNLENKRELGRNQSDISETTENLDQLLQGMGQFAEQEADYKKIEAVGFFDSQNRVETRKRLNLMQQESRLIAAKYAIKPAVTQKNKKAQEAGYRVIETEIGFTLEAIEDADIYKFIYLLNHGFPGYIAIESMDISREKKVTQPLLRKIGAGTPEVMVKADMKVRWLTMIPDPDVKPGSDDQAGGQP